MANTEPTSDERKTLETLRAWADEADAWFDNGSKGSIPEIPSTPYDAFNSGNLQEQLQHAYNARHLFWRGIPQPHARPITFDDPKWRKMVGFVKQ